MMFKNNKIEISALLLTSLILTSPSFAAGEFFRDTTYVSHLGANEWGYVTVTGGKAGHVTIQARVESPQPHDIRVDSKQNIGATGFKARLSKALMPGPVYVSKDADGNFSYKQQRIPGECALWLTFRPRKLAIDVVNVEACGFKPDLDFSGIYMHTSTRQ